MRTLPKTSGTGHGACPTGEWLRRHHPSEAFLAVPPSPRRSAYIPT